MALLVATSLAGPAPAPAAQGAAIEEYVLTLPGSPRVGEGTPPPLLERSRRAGPVGVTGESEPGGSAVAAIGSAAASPAGLVLLAALGTGALLAIRRGGRRR